MQINVASRVYLWRGIKMKPQARSFSLSMLLCLFLPFSSYAEEFAGILQWSARVAISTPVSGVIEQVYANVGDIIPKGEKLLQLDDAVFKVDVSSAKSALTNRTEEYKEVKRELDRMQELYDRTMLSEHDLQVAKNNLVKAKASKEKAAANYTKALHDLKYSTVRAPFDAIVLERKAQPGQVISTRFQPETLFVIAAANRMLARIQVPEPWLGRLKKGKEAEVVLNSEKFPGKVLAIGMEPVSANSGKTSYPVDIEFHTQNKLLRAGQQARVIIE